MFIIECILHIVSARAYLLGGSEIITFDGSHLHVAGDCSYVLTQDYLDGNFSVVANFKGGHLDAIQVSDGTDMVELRHDKKVRTVASFFCINSLHLIEFIV